MMVSPVAELRFFQLSVCSTPPAFASEGAEFHEKSQIFLAFAGRFLYISIMKILVREKDWRNTKRSLKGVFALAAGVFLYSHLSRAPEPADPQSDAVQHQTVNGSRAPDLKIVAARTIPGPAQIDSALKKATAHSVVPFRLMHQVAKTESSFRPDAVNDKSGACGAYQIDPDGTMLELIKKHGSQHGYGVLANNIDATPHKLKNGRVKWEWDVTTRNPRIANAISNACFDPQLSAFMATDYMADNAQHLRQVVRHRQANFTDAYIEHFLGPGDAAKFLGAHENKKLRKHSATAYVTHDAAAQNHGIFFRGNGKPRSVSDVYNILAAKMTMEKLPPVMLAANTGPETFRPR
jgi:hypothetical protein